VTFRVVEEFWVAEIECDMSKEVIAGEPSENVLTLALRYGIINRRYQEMRTRFLYGSRTQSLSMRELTLLSNWIRNGMTREWRELYDKNYGVG
jgi:hypothetical protein